MELGFSLFQLRALLFQLLLSLGQFLPQHRLCRLKLRLELIQFALPASLGHQFAVQVSLEHDELLICLSLLSGQSFDPLLQVNISPLLQGDLLTAQELDNEYDILQKKRSGMSYMIARRQSTV